MHIINGDSAAGSFKQAFHLPAETILVFRDVLSCGALNKFTDAQSWSRERNSYWTDMFSEYGFGPIDEAPRDFYKNIEELEKADEANLWIGCALSDHLLLVFTVLLFQHYKLDIQGLKIHQYLKFRDQNLTVTGLGLLNPDQIKALSPTPSTLDTEQVKFCLETWQAITAPSPDQLMDILERKNVSLPLLQKALWNFFYRYPDASNGLSRFDEIILKAAKDHAPSTARIIGHTIGHDMYFSGEEGIHELDTVGDIYLFARLKNMAKPSLKQPLLSLNTMDTSLCETTVNITEFGLKVLNGHANVIEVNDINDDVAGVRLRSHSKRIWLRKGRALIEAK